MALYATNRFPGDGVTTSREINFVGKYLSRDHVKAYTVDDTTGTITPIVLTSANFLNDTTLQGLPVTPVGATLVVYRDTPRVPLVDFNNGSRITETSLDIAARQGLFVAAEAADAGDVAPNDIELVNVGGGAGVVAGETAGQVRVKSLVAGANVSIISTAETLTVSAASGGGGTSAALTVAVIGDSLAAQQVLLGASWPEILGTQLQAGGNSCVVHNLAINGYTFNKANTLQSFGVNTQVAQAIALAPDVVIVALGHNDAMLQVEGRDLATVKADASAVFSALRVGLPTSAIVYGSEVAYDSTHGLAVSLTNQQTIPFLMERRASGILAGLACSEILPDACSALTRQRLGNWADLDSYIKALGTIDGNFNLHIWKASRIGLSGTDGLHLTDMGAHFLAGNARKAFATLPALTAKAPWLSDQNYVWFMDSDNLFSSLVESNGTVFVTRPWAVNADHAARNYGPYRVCNPDTWHLPSKGAYFSANLAYTQGTVFDWSLTNVAPNSVVSASINGGAWESVGVSNSYGDFHTAAVLPDVVFTVGSHTIRYKVGTEVHGPVTLTVSPGAGGGGGEAYVLPAASDTVRGGVKVGSNLTITGDVLAVPVASPSNPGVVTVGAGLAVAGAVLSAPLATSGVAGRVKPGANTAVSGDGTLTTIAATALVAGAVKPGTGLSVTADGTLNASGGGGGITEGAWQTLTLNAPWSEYSGRTPRYRLVGTTVQFSGAMYQGGATGPAIAVNVGTLPLGFRPTGLVGVAIAGGNQRLASLVSDTAGSVIISCAGDATAGNIVFLDGAFFSTT